MKYALAVNEVLTEKMPDMMDRIERLVARIERVTEEGAEEITKVDFRNKISSAKNLAVNTKQLGKVPTIFKEQGENMKQCLDELRESIDAIKNNQAKFKEDGIKCAGSNITDSVGCYKQINGSITYSQKQRKEWEVWVDAVLWDKDSKRYVAANYPTTDLVADEVKK